MENNNVLSLNSFDDNSGKLTDEQKKIILDRCNAPGNPPGIKELCILVFGPGTDGRDRRSKLIKEFCGSMGKKFRVSNEYNKITDEVHFSPEQEQFIKKHVNQMNATEIARILWADPTITNLDARARATRYFIEKQAEYIHKPENDEIPSKEYEPPTTLQSACFRVNKYVREAISKEELEKDTRVRKNLECLIRFCHNPRVVSLMNRFEKQGDRNLFESCFIRYLYSIGEELSEPDLDGYVSLCLEVVNRTNLQGELERLNRMRDQSLDQDQKLSMSIVEMIGKIHTAIDNTEKRQNQLRQSLEGTRSKRLELKIQNNQSVTQLVEAWRQDDKRKRLIKLAEARRERNKNELIRLDNLDDLKVEMFGIDREAY